jgi:zinc transporter 2
MYTNQNKNSNKYVKNLSSTDNDIGNKSKPDPQSTALKKMIKITIICSIFLIVEMVGGYIAGSLAIMTDAAHLFSDLSGFVISIIAIYIGRKKPNKKFTFGYFRAEVIGAMTSVITIWILTGILIKEAIDRVFNPGPIQAGVMLLTSIVGLICNLAMMNVLHSGHGHGHAGCSHGHGKQKENPADITFLNITEEHFDGVLPNDVSELKNSSPRKNSEGNNLNSEENICSHDHSSDDITNHSHSHDKSHSHDHHDHSDSHDHHDHSHSHDHHDHSNNHHDHNDEHNLHPHGDEEGIIS